MSDTQCTLRKNVVKYKKPSLKYFIPMSVVKEHDLSKVERKKTDRE